MKAAWATLIASQLVMALGCSARHKPAATMVDDPDLQRLVGYMVGSFTSQKQAERDPEFRIIHLHMTAIWQTRTDGYWLYVEQAAAETPNQPYRQRIYHLIALADKSFQSEVYELPGDLSEYVGGWSNPAKLAYLSPEKLKLKPGCSLILRKQSDGSFQGATTGTGCPSELRGAKYATSQAHIMSDGLDTWDRGYDAGGKQVWGAEKGPYEFRRVRDKDNM